MTSIEVKTKDVKDIVNATFPKYRKRMVRIYATTEVRFSDLNWSGGTRAEYRACTINGRPLSSAYDMSAPAPWANPFEGKTVGLPVGAVIVEGGHFCGKEATLRINVHPENMPKFIAQG